MGNQSAMSKDHVQALREKAVGQVAEAGRVLGQAGSTLMERGGKLEAEAARLESLLGPPQPQPPAGFWRTARPFVVASAAGALATCVIQPVDTSGFASRSVDCFHVMIQSGEGTAGQITKNMLANEGFHAFYKGLSAGLLRQATYTTARLGSFRVLTNKAVEKNDGKPLPETSLVQEKFPLSLLKFSGHMIGTTAVSGFFASACGLPFDYVKTQIQKMHPDDNGKFPYTGSLDCAVKTFNSGGPLKFYAGFPGYYARIAPHVMMSWIFFNQIQKLENKIRA